MLEAVIALAVLSLLTAIVATRTSVAVEQIATHAAFQDFQTALVNLRGRAFAQRTALQADAQSAPLPAGWTFRSAGPLTVDEAGICTGGAVELVHAGRVRATLEPAGGECRYLRRS